MDVFKQLRENLKKKMVEDNISQEELSDILGISRKTLIRFVTNEKNISPQTIKTLRGYVEGGPLARKEKKDFFLPKIRCSAKQYQFFKDQAERTGVSIGVVLSKYVDDIVTNDYLWEDYGKHLEISERALKSVLEKYMLPFIFSQDKMISELMIQARVNLRANMAINSEINPDDNTTKDRLSDWKALESEKYYKELAKRGDD